MNESFYTAIQAARSPDEMKAAVIAALRELDGKAAADPWASGWDDHETHLAMAKGMDRAIAERRDTRSAVFRTQEEADAARLALRIEADPTLARHIAALEDALITCVDSEEEQAIIAKLKLLKEGGDAPEYLIEEGVRPTIVSDGTNGVVDFAAVSVERKAMRYEWAKDHRLWEFIALDEDQSCEAFAKGGPMWLYLDEGGRDAILAMPPEWRAWLIAEVALDSPAEAHNMGRDLLKQEDALDPDNSPQGQAAHRRADEAFGG